MGFWGYEDQGAIKSLSMVTYNTSCDPNPGLLPNGTNLIFEALVADCIKHPQNCTEDLIMYINSTRNQTGNNEKYNQPDTVTNSTLEDSGLTEGQSNSSIVTTVTIILVLIILGLLIFCIIVIALYERHLQKKRDKKQKET